MNKHKTLPLFWAAFSLLLLFSVNPAQAGSNAKPVDVDTLFNCTWTAATVAPALLLDAPTVTVGGNMYLFGGVQGGAISAASFKFDGTTWTPIAPLPAAVEFPAAVTDGTNCYIMGGALTGTGTPQTTLWRYNVATNDYTTLAPFTTGVWNHSAVYLAGKIYKFAGTGPGTASTNAHEIYTIATNTWAPGAAYPLAISFTSGWTQGGFIYGAGGIDSVTSTGSAKTFRYDPALNTWDDASIADLPATRWGAATAFYSPDVVLAGGYVAGSVTASISNTAISWDQPSNTWNSIPNMLQARSRMTGAVLGNSVYVVGGRCTTVGVCDAFQGTTDNQKLTCLNVPTAVMSAGGSSIATGGANGVLDPGETVTVALGVKNTGGPGVVCTSAGLMGTLQPGGGVIPTGMTVPQSYGGTTGLCSGGSPNLTIFRYFTFMVDPALSCGGTVTATLRMQDPGTVVPPVPPVDTNLTYTFVTGISVVAASENFDGVGAPALPAGWTASATGIGVAYVTSTTTPNSPPNAAFAPDPSNIGDSMLLSPNFAVPAGGATLSFKNHYITESTYDGVVLEISINGGAFADIITAGGTFITGGYTGPISTSFGSPIAGRQAWNGTNPGSPAYITSTVTLPPAANGQMAQLKWRMASDNSVAATGSWIDDVVISNRDCGGSAPAGPTVPTVGTPKSVLSHTGVGNLGIAMPADVKVTGLTVLPPNRTGGVECRRGNPTANANYYNYTLVVPFAAPVSFGAVPDVTSATGGTAASAAVDPMNPNNVIITLTDVADVPLATGATIEGQVLGITLKDVSAGSNKGNVNIQMGILIGDTNDSRVINSGDRSGLGVQMAPPSEPTSVRYDVNRDGLFNSGDGIIIRNHIPDSIP